jgi:hypothetical protein
MTTLRFDDGDGVRAPDTRSVELDRAVTEIERVVGHLDLHQRIAIERAVDRFADSVPRRCDPWC